MDEKILSFNENQLKKSGFGEACTPELRAQMEQGVPFIQHTFQKQFDGDRLEATVHLKKSAISDYYSLKKFDLQLQKEGLAGAVKHSFKITDTNFGTNQVNDHHFKSEDRFTLQEAYNLLAGRSVYKNLIGPEGNKEHAWVNLNLKNDSINNDPERKLYQTTYGYDLEKVLNHYSIKEMKSERTKLSLIQSLQRGNIKKVTFVGPRKQEDQLYISPDISRGSLDVRDKHKQKLSTDELVERKFISKDLAQSVKEISGQRQKVEIKDLQLQEPTQKLLPTLKKDIKDSVQKKYRWA